MGKQSGPNTDRAARVAELRKQQAKAERKRRVVTIAAIATAAAVGAGIIGFAALQGGGSDDPRTTTGELPGVTITTPEGGQHTQDDVDYPNHPPVGGKHDPAWANCKVYDKPIRDENAVHAMEHGAVWLTYRPDLPSGDVKKLKGLVPKTYALMSPYPGQNPPVVATAWGRQMEMTGAEDPRIEQFIRAYRLGKASPETGAACTGGVDGTNKG